MYRKAIIFVILMAVCRLASAQLNDKERNYVIEKLYFPSPRLDFTYSFTSGDLLPNKNTPVKRAEKEKEIAKLKKKIKNIPSDAEVYDALSRAYASIFKREEAKDYETKAISNYRKWIALEPNNVEAQDNLANLYISTQQYKEAESIYQSLLKKSPNNYNYLAGLRLVYLQTNNSIAYKEASERLINLDDSKLAGHFGIVFFSLLNNIEQVDKDADELKLHQIVPIEYIDALIERYPKKIEFQTLSAAMYLLGISFAAYIQSEELNDIENLSLTKSQIEKLAEVKTFFKELPNKGYKNEAFVNYSLMVAAFFEKDIDAVRTLHRKNHLMSPYFLQSKTNAFVIATTFKAYDFALEALQDKISIYHEEVDELFEAKLYFKKKDFAK
ncbi:MAG: tetratricopeptide repeat protein, partial [Bacteroidota bacterium]